MPTGATASLADFAKIIDFCREHKILFRHDNPYSRILEPQSAEPAAADGALDCAYRAQPCSANRTNMAGWRVGMLCETRIIIKVKAISTPDNFADATCAAQALQNSDEWHAEQKRRVCGSPATGVSVSGCAHCTTDSGSAGMFAWANCRMLQKRQRLWMIWSIQKDIFYRAGSIFRQRRGYIRNVFHARRQRKLQRQVGRFPEAGFWFLVSGCWK